MCQVQERQLSLSLLCSYSPEAEIHRHILVHHKFDTLRYILIIFDRNVKIFGRNEEEDQ